MMPVETRPNLANICPEQRLHGTTHWYLWLEMQQHPDWQADIAPLLSSIEREMQPETLHQLALARNRYWREMSPNIIDKQG